MICGVAVDHFGPPSVLYVGWFGVICLLPFALVLLRGERTPVALTVTRRSASSISSAPGRSCCS